VLQPCGRLRVRDLHLHIEPLLARNVVDNTLHRTVWDIAHLTREGPDLGHPKPQLLDNPGDILRLYVDEVPDAVLPLEDDRETGDHVAQKALRPETDNGGDDGGPRRGRQRVTKEDAQDHKHHDDKDHVTERVAHQGDRSVLAL